MIQGLSMHAHCYNDSLRGYKYVQERKDKGHRSGTLKSRPLMSNEGMWGRMEDIKHLSLHWRL